MVEKIDPLRFKRLAQAARDHAARRVALYEQLARITLPRGAETSPQADGQQTAAVVRNRKED
jgi:hypothetical protein